MAYKKSLIHNCQVASCGDKAVYEVFNRFNASCGKFCKLHADYEQHRMQKAEDESPSQSFIDIG